MRSMSCSLYSTRRHFAIRLHSTANDNSHRPIALVTGSSRGIGRSIAIALGDAGCRVIVNYLSNKAAADEVVKLINDRNIGSAIAIQANCADSSEVQVMFKKIVAEVGSVSVLVNNAGITRDGLAIRMKPKDFSDVIDLNLNGAFYCSQAAFSSSFLSQRRGRIINIASVVGQIGNLGQANYAAAKSGLLGMTKALAKEFAARNVTVNAVCPGYIESDMTKDVNRENILTSIPLKRFGTPEEVAGLVKFLALDPAAAYITGHSFNIDGGLAIGAT